VNKLKNGDLCRFKAAHVLPMVMTAVRDEPSVASLHASDTA
jgi:hypothetical protein